MSADDPIRLKPEDSPVPPFETVQPRRVRTHLVALDGRLLAHQDDAAALFDLVRGDEARRILRRLYNGLEGSHEAVRAAIVAVERGG